MTNEAFYFGIPSPAAIILFLLTYVFLCLFVAKSVVSFFFLCSFLRVKILTCGEFIEAGFKGYFQG